MKIADAIKILSTLDPESVLKIRRTDDEVGSICQDPESGITWIFEK
jgi:hypothetical protein